MGGSFIRFTSDEIQQARNADTVEVITRYSGYSFRRNGDEFKSIEHDSLTVFRDRKGFAWYSKGLKGCSAVDWLVKVENKKFTEAVGIILGRNGLEQSAYRTIKEADVPLKSKELVLPAKYGGAYTRVTAYLVKSRGIDPNVVSWCMTEHILYQDDHYNCVFLGKAQDGTPKYAMKRGTLTQLPEGQKPYKRECLGSDKSFGFCMQGTIKEHIYVFEAPIDALSHASFNILKNKALGQEHPEKAFLRHTRLALGGTCENALQRYLIEHPCVNEISFCLDGDEAGRTNTDLYAKKYRDKGYKVNTYDIPSGYGKDYNEFLQIYRQQLAQTQQNQTQKQTTQRKR